MKHTLLATTALVTVAGAAHADLTISATGRIGLKTTEGSVAVAAKTTYGKITAAVKTTYDLLGTKLAIAKTPVVNSYNHTQTTIALGTKGDAATASDITDLDQMINTAELRLQGGSKSGAAVILVPALIDTAAERAVIAADIVTLKAIRARLVTEAAAVAAVADTTDAANRFRISFAGSGETDGGISYGISGRAEQSNSSLSGTQHVSGAFGKIKMGDLGGADKDATGNISGVGLTGLGDHNEVSYQAATHNVGYEYTAAGLTFGYSQNSAVKTGSNSAMGVKYSGDLSGATVSVGVGQSKVGTSTQSTMSVSASSGGLTLKAISSTNDNGPAVVAADGTARNTAGANFAIDTLAAANNDTDTTGVSISYAMDGMTVTGFTKTVSTIGAADMDYSGFGFAYDMGGVSLKAGVVDNNDQQLIDFGLSFSF
jgi:outer membrane protein OmpU